MSEITQSRSRREHQGPYIPGSILGKHSGFGMYVEGDAVVPYIEVDMEPLGAVLSGDTLIVSSGLDNNGPDDGIVRTKTEHMAQALRKAGIIPDVRKERPPEQLTIKIEHPVRQLELFDSSIMSQPVISRRPIR